MQGLYNYIEREMYDSTYGDMVPDVTANALDVNIIIVEKHGYDYICYCTGENADMSTQLPLLVFKSGKHYDGLIHVNSSNRGFSNDVNVNLMTGTPECSESASIYSMIHVARGLALKWLTPNHVTSPAHIMMYLFELFIKPVLVYGSEIWGTNVNATKSIDKVFLWYAGAILRVKSNTSNLITLGECGVIPPSVACHKQLLCYFKRLQNMCEDTLVKKVFNELNVLDTLGFSKWISSVRDLALRYNLDMNEEQSTE